MIALQITLAGCAALPRRTALSGAVLSAAPRPSSAAPARVEGFGPRVEGIGSGADMLSELPPRAPDVLFPPSLLGYWRCERAVLGVEGDITQAGGAWFDLGGYLGGETDFRRKAEAYYTRFVPSPAGVATDGGTGTVADRAFELESRVRGAIVSVSGNSLTFERTAVAGSTPTTITIVQRKVELPSDNGWGSDELVRVTTTAGGLFGASQLVKAARVQRRYRRAYDDAGGRVVQGLEILKTYRVLDGIAGVEMPTSTTKSQLRLTRPSAEQLQAIQGSPPG